MTSEGNTLALGSKKERVKSTFQFNGPYPHEIKERMESHTDLNDVSLEHIIYQMTASISAKDSFLQDLKYRIKTAKRIFSSYEERQISESTFIKSFKRFLNWLNFFIHTAEPLLSSLDVFTETLGISEKIENSITKPIAENLYHESKMLINDEEVQGIFVPMPKRLKHATGDILQKCFPKEKEVFIELSFPEKEDCQVKAVYSKSCQTLSINNVIKNVRTCACQTLFYTEVKKSNNKQTKSCQTQILTSKSKACHTQVDPKFNKATKQTQTTFPNCLESKETQTCEDCAPLQIYNSQTDLLFLNDGFSTPTEYIPEIDLIGLDKVSEISFVESLVDFNSDQSSFKSENENFFTPLLDKSPVKKSASHSNISSQNMAHELISTKSECTLSSRDKIDTTVESIHDRIASFKNFITNLHEEVEESLSKGVDIFKQQTLLGLVKRSSDFNKTDYSNPLAVEIENHNNIEEKDFKKQLNFAVSVEKNENVLESDKVKSEEKFKNPLLLDEEVEILRAELLKKSSVKNIKNSKSNQDFTEEINKLKKELGLNQSKSGGNLNIIAVKKMSKKKFVKFREDEKESTKTLQTNMEKMEEENEENIKRHLMNELEIFQIENIGNISPLEEGYSQKFRKSKNFERDKMYSDSINNSPKASPRKSKLLKANNTEKLISPPLKRHLLSSTKNGEENNDCFKHQIIVPSPRKSTKSNLDSFSKLGSSKIPIFLHSKTSRTWTFVTSAPSSPRCESLQKKISKIPVLVKSQTAPNSGRRKNYPDSFIPVPTRERMSKKVSFIVSNALAPNESSRPRKLSQKEGKKYCKKEVRKRELLSAPMTSCGKEEPQSGEGLASIFYPNSNVLGVSRKGGSYTTEYSAAFSSKKSTVCLPPSPLQESAKKLAANFNVAQ